MPNEFIIKNGYFSQGNSTITGSLTVTSGITGSVLSSSYALTASYALTSGGGGGGGATFAGGTNVDNRIITATGTTPELNGEANLTFGGSILSVTGSIIANSFTGSLQGTSSWANNAITASYALQALSASFTTSASFASNALSASFAISSSRAVSASFSTSASFAISSSRAISSSFATSASFAISSSLTNNAYFAQGKLSADQLIPSATDTVIEFVDHYDPQGWWDSGTYQFLPTIAGYYRVSLGVWFANPLDNTNQLNAQIRSNGSAQVMIVQQPTTTISGVSLFGTKIIYFNGSSDYIDFTVFQANSLNNNINIQQGSGQGSGTWFSAEYMTM